MADQFVLYLWTMFWYVRNDAFAHPNWYATPTRNGSERSFVDFFCRHIKEMIRVYAAVIRNNDTQRVRWYDRLLEEIYIFRIKV